MASMTEEEGKANPRQNRWCNSCQVKHWGDCSSRCENCYRFHRAACWHPCYYCGLNGHIISHCVMKFRDESQQSVTNTQQASTTSCRIPRLISPDAVTFNVHGHGSVFVTNEGTGTSMAITVNSNDCHGESIPFHMSNIKLTLSCLLVSITVRQMAGFYRNHYSNGLHQLRTPRKRRRKALGHQHGPRHADAPSGQERRLDSGRIESTRNMAKKEESDEHIEGAIYTAMEEEEPDGEISPACRIC